MIRRRIWTPLLALCMLWGLSLTAYATLIEPELTGSITIHSLAVDNTGDYTTPGAGEVQETVEGEPLADMSYTVTRVTDDTTDPLNFQPVVGEGAYKETIATDQYGRAKFDKLSLGVYLVQQQESLEVEAEVDDFLVEIPMTDPTGQSRIYNVNVYPKYQKTVPLDIDAFVSSVGNKSDSADLYGTSAWIITTQLPATIAEAKGYQIQSNLHSGLAFAVGSVNVYADGADMQRVDLVLDDDYSVARDGQTLSVTLLPGGLAKLGAVPEISGATLYTEYQTILDIPEEDLPGLLAQPVDIDAQLNYTNAQGRPNNSTMDGDKPYVYTGGVSVVKTAGGNPLEGAAFQIYRSRADALAEENPVKTPGGTGDWTATTNPNGTAAFYGLAYGEPGDSNTGASAEYYLVQTAAPAGYNLLRGPVEITVDAGSHLEENQVQIQGKSGFLLPATGGMGTVWFTVIGLLLIGLAVYLFLRRQRKRERDDIV